MTISHIGIRLELSSLHQCKALMQDDCIQSVHCEDNLEIIGLIVVPRNRSYIYRTQRRFEHPSITVFTVYKEMHI